MTTPAYPLGMPTFLTQKTREQVASFTMAEPRRGYGYAQQVGTDTPVFWNISFRFTSEQAARFMLWFITVINSGADEFTIPIKTEFGVIPHTVRFLPDSLLNTSQDGFDVTTYSATIMARGQAVPEAYLEAAGIIIATSDWQRTGMLLDEAIADRKSVV
jgi:hypothetical protein